VLPAAEPLTIEPEGTPAVSGLWLRPVNARAALVLAHGAGAGMTHARMETLARDLAERGIATLRYQFPYMENGRRRPDPPPVTHATVRAAVSAAARGSGLPLFAGGRSFGGRMTSQAQAASPLPQVQGLVFFAFPLHPADQPSSERGKHLFEIQVPMLFLQGTRDVLADVQHLQPLCDKLGERATLKLLSEADHSFDVLARSGRTDAEVRREMLDAVDSWLQRVISATADETHSAVQSGC
jgi:predicted alpha/beta-hydrolase family hydrolase